MTIINTRRFGRELKRLAKKYPSINKEMRQIITELRENPSLGTSMGGGFRKIRLSIASKGKGKSGGGRLITHVRIVAEKVFLVTIYDKSEISNIDDDALEDFLSDYPE
jgi:hypothetical protein